MRIVSLLPSATEFLCELGLADSLVGVSHSCDYPAGVRSLPQLTSTSIDKNADGMEIHQQVQDGFAEGKPLYAVDSEQLQQLRPDIVVTQGLCQVCAVTGNELGAALRDAKLSAEVVSLEPHSLQDILQTWSLLGEATGRQREARDKRETMEQRLDAVRNCAEGEPTIGFLEWLQPPFTPGHWNHDLIEWVGGIDPFGEAGEASRALSMEEIAVTALDHCIVACCGMDVEQTRREIDKLNWSLLKEAVVVDGDQYFSRPGPRIADSAEILAAAIRN